MTFSPSRSSSLSGVALVMVLAVLVLVTGLVVTLLSLAKGERKSASVFLTNEGIRQLADNAVGIVQAQINHATTQASAVAWASQPGMIRTYKTDGRFDTAYKLYSASSLTETNVATFSSSNPDYPPSDWASSPALWSDLNSPVNSDGTNIYPIINPAALDLSTAARPQGFDIVAAPGSTTNQRAPMPVRWLYILQDGQIVAPTGSGTAVVVSQSTSSNPIKGRIAFWTDDDSCKVNVNTASAGASGANSGFWDTPRYDTVEDRKFATSQPLNGEFQRYPGHPAMTSLSAVFPTLSDQAILSTVTPRYQWGGSMQGTTDTVFTMNQALKSGSLATGPLYADPDELIFQPSTSSRAQNSNLPRDSVDRARFFLTADSQAPEVNLFNLPRIACWPVHANLAVNLTSANTTAFDRLIARCASTGTGNNLNRYYFQRQNALSPSDDANIPRNQQLFSYLQYLTSQTIPGFGVNFASKFGADRDQILTEIWDYIRCVNLADSRLGNGCKFTADDSNTNGYGYVVPLETGTSTTPNRGFGRTMTVSELAFIFICTADPKDKLPDPTKTAGANANGLLGSNDPANNLTLGGKKLNPDERRIQMMIVPKFFSPSHGDVFMLPKNMRVTISGLTSLKLGTNQLFINNSGSRSLSDFSFNSGWHHRSLGGPFDYRSFIDGSKLSTGRSADHDPGILDTASPAYPFISQFVTVPVKNPSYDQTVSPGTMDFVTDKLTVTIETSADGATWQTSQEITITPPSLSKIPIPNLVRTDSNSDSTTGAPASKAQCWWAFSNNGPCPSLGGTWGRLALLYAHPGFSYISSNLARDTSDIRPGSLIRGADSYIYYTDVVRSMALSHGDARLVCALKKVPSDAFSAVGNWGDTGATKALMHTLGTGYYISQYTPGCSQYRRHFVTTNMAGTDATMGAGGKCAPDFRNDLASKIYSAVSSSGDFDTAVAFWTDGAYINKPDEGNVYTSANSTPYFVNNSSEKINSEAYFSPNRIIPGPGMFGSLPTYIKRYAADPSHPELYAWRTLLFRKQPGHPDAAAVTTGGISALAPDHLLMDLFWMPTVEPYAISEPFSTAGKVNMNYQIQPFTYIQRPTGMYAVLQRERIEAVTNDASTYAKYKDTDTAANLSLRLDLDVNKTLEQFDARFSDSSGRLFLSPSELCDLWLVPQGESVNSMPSFWTTRNLTGDNMRERPYTTIIPRLTTRSNTYTIHYRVQTLQQTRAGRSSSEDWTKWTEGKDQITGEYRGSTTIQRFVDMNDSTLLSTDFAINTGNVPSLNQFYRWRVINTKQFAP